MSRFLRKIALLSLLLSPFVLTFVWVNINVGEVLPIATIAQRQQDNPDAVVARVWQRDEIVRYKYASYLIRDPDIITLGSSLVREFDQSMFTDATFYNFTIDGMVASEVSAIMQQMAEDKRLPKIIILDVNPSTFNGADFETFDTDAFLLSPVGRFNQLRTKSQIPFQYLMADGFNLMLPKFQPKYYDAQGRLALGLNARYENEGVYHADGYYQKARGISVDEQRASDMQHFTSLIDQRIEHARPNNILLPHEVAALDNILKIARENDVMVIAVSLPYHQLLLDLYSDNPDEYTFWEDGQTMTEGLLRQYDYPYVFIPDSSAMGGNDDEMFDTVHMGKRLSLRALTYLVATFPDVLDPYTDITALEAMLNQHDHWYYIEPPA